MADMPWGAVPSECATLDRVVATDSTSVSRSWLNDAHIDGVDDQGL